MFEIEKFQKFDVFRNWKIWEMFRIFEIANFSKSPHCKFLEFSKLIFLEFFKLKCLRIFQIWSFWNCPNWKINKFQDFCSIWKLKVWPPKIRNFGIVHPFDIPHYSQFCQFSYLPFDINQFRCFNFSTFISYSSGNFLDCQIHRIINFMKWFNSEN